MRFCDVSETKMSPFGATRTIRIEASYQFNPWTLSGSNFDQAIDIVTRFKSKSAFVYAMGQEPWLGYIMSLKYTEQSRPIVESNRLIQDCSKRNICAERLFGEKEILIENLN